MRRPASRAHPGRKASALYLLRWMQPAHPRAARARGGRPDPDRVTRETRMRPGRGQLGRRAPGASLPPKTPSVVTHILRFAAGARGQARPGPGDSDAPRELGRHRIRRSRPTPKRIWPSGPPLDTRPYRRRGGVPFRERGRARRRQGSSPSARPAQSRDGRRRPEAAPGPALDWCDRHRMPPVDGECMDSERGRWGPDSGSGDAGARLVARWRDEEPSSNFASSTADLQLQ